MRNLVNDSRTVLAYDFEEDDRAAQLFEFGPLGVHHDGQAIALPFRERPDQTRLLFPRHLHPENAGELAPQPRHPALEPVAAVLRHQTGQRIDQARSVPANHRHHQ